MTARTLALVREIPVHGVCSLDILAAEAIDARARGVRGRDGCAAQGGLPRVVRRAGGGCTGPQVLKPEDAATESLVVGRGGSLYPEDFPNVTGPEHPSAAVLCDVVLRRRFEILGPEPLYLRRPDAAEPGKPKRVS